MRNSFLQRHPTVHAPSTFRGAGSSRGFHLLNLPEEDLVALMQNAYHWVDFTSARQRAPIILMGHPIFQQC